VRGNVLAEIWLNIPQAVVLEATGDLKRARGLKERDPQLLLVKAALLLPPLGSVPIEPDASDEEVRLALRKIREKIEPRSSERSYAVSLRRVHAKLIDGVTAKGRRASNLPLEVIDPAEFVCLELDDLNAVNPRTGETIFYDLLVCARELIDGKSEASFGSEFSSAPREPDIGDQKLAQVSQAMIGGTAEIGSSTKPAPPLSDRDLRSWYEERVAELTAGGEASSGEADWQAAKRQFPGRITRSRLRQVRDQFAPADWKKQGKRAPKTVK
jgi:hypothetical protein